MSRRDVALGDRFCKALVDRARDGVERDLPRERCEAAEQRRVGERSSGVLARELTRGHRHEALGAKALDELAEAQLGKALRGVDQDEAVPPDAREDVHLVEQRRVADDQRVRLHHRFARADLALVDAAEGHDRRTHALGAEARERLRPAPLVECRKRQQLRGRDDALTAAPVDADLEHRLIAARGVEQHALLGRGDERAGARDHVDVDRDRVDPGTHKQVCVLRVHRGRLPAD